MNRLTQKTLAAELDISPAMVSKLKRAGMPVDSIAAAAAWRSSNIDPALRKGNRLVAADPAIAVSQLGALVVDDPSRLEELRAAIQALTRAAQDRVVLDFSIWDQLVAPHLEPLCEPDGTLRDNRRK